jgi:nucleoside-diphosphate-sugar epimerase
VRAAVTGATGYIGRFIVERLAAEGVEICAWRRSGSNTFGLPPSVDWVDGGLDRPDSFARLLQDADLLVHAALDHSPGRYRGGEGDDLPRFLSTNVGGSLHLLAAARAAGLGRCVVLSSRAVFDGRTAEGPIGDAEPVWPVTNYGAAKAALESFVQVWGGEGWPVAALRPTGVYGVTEPVENSKWFGLVSQALRGEPVPPRAGGEVHGRDVADAVWRIATAEPFRVAGRMFNCSDIVVSARELVEIVHKLAGVSGPLPDPSPPPRNRMDCPGLAGLGQVFGGRPMLEKTLAALVAAHRGRRRKHAPARMCFM